MAKYDAQIQHLLFQTMKKLKASFASDYSQTFAGMLLVLQQTGASPLEIKNFKSVDEQINFVRLLIKLNWWKQIAGDSRLPRVIYDVRDKEGEVIGKSIYEGIA
ncbi:MAG: hypothetical protein ACFFDN_34615, partial [Candidatus Hodarchaeota archaeon]